MKKYENKDNDELYEINVFRNKFVYACNNLRNMIEQI